MDEQETKKKIEETKEKQRKKSNNADFMSFRKEKDKKTGYIWFICNKCGSAFQQKPEKHYLDLEKKELCK